MSYVINKSSAPFVVRTSHAVVTFCLKTKEHLKPFFILEILQVLLDFITILKLMIKSPIIDQLITIVNIGSK